MRVTFEQLEAHEAKQMPKKDRAELDPEEP